MPWPNYKVEENWLGSVGYKKWLRILLDLLPQTWQWFQTSSLLVEPILIEYKIVTWGEHSYAFLKSSFLPEGKKR